MVVDTLANVQRCEPAHLAPLQRARVNRGGRQPAARPGPPALATYIVAVLGWGRGPWHDRVAPPIVPPTHRLRAIPATCFASAAPFAVCVATTTAHCLVPIHGAP